MWPTLEVSEKETDKVVPLLGLCSVVVHNQSSWQTNRKQRGRHIFGRNEEEMTSYLTCDYNGFLSDTAVLARVVYTLKADFQYGNFPGNYWKATENLVRAGLYKPRGLKIRETRDAWKVLWKKSLLKHKTFTLTKYNIHYDPGWIMASIKKTFWKGRHKGSLHPLWRAQ